MIALENGSRNNRQLQIFHQKTPGHNLTLVGAFLEKRRPAPHVRPMLDFGFRISGQSVELFEIRPQWDRPEIRRESSFAKATFVRNQAIWKVYWMRADLRWHSYEPAAEVAAIEDFLAVVQKDE